MPEGIFFIIVAINASRFAICAASLVPYHLIALYLCYETQT